MLRENTVIELFNKARKHAFSVFNKYDSYDKSIFFLTDPRYSELNHTAKMGLQAELYFYSKYKKEFKLTPALDCGDKTDFTGEIESRLSRIDVTTNLSYKDRGAYSEFIYDGFAFWLVEVNLESGDIMFIPLHFPQCENCEKPLYNLAFIEPHSNPALWWSGYIQIIQKICISCRIYKSGPILDYKIPKFSIIEKNYADELLALQYFDYEESEREDISKSIKQQMEEDVLARGSSIVRLVKKEFNQPIAFVGETDAVTMGSSGDKFLEFTRIYWNNQWAPNIKEIKIFF